MKLGPNLSLALAIGGGLALLVVVHSIAAGQKAADSAITVGATLTSPFNVMPDTSGSLVNNAVATNPVADTTGGAASSTVVPASDGYTGFTHAIFPQPPAGVPMQGWAAAMSGVIDHSQMSVPA